MEETFDYGHGDCCCCGCADTAWVGSPATEDWAEPVWTEETWDTPTWEEPAPAYDPALFEAPAAPVYEAPVYETPVYETPATPVFEAPAAPVYAAPVYEAPVYENPEPFGNFVIGGNSSPDFTIVDPSGDPVAPLTSMVIGGSTFSDSVRVMDAGENPLPGGMYVGGGTASLDPLSELIAERQMETTRRLNEFHSSPMATGTYDPVAAIVTPTLMSNLFRSERNLNDVMSPLFRSGDDLDPNSMFYRNRA